MKINKYINEIQKITINFKNKQNEIENLNNIQKDIIDILNLIEDKKATRNH